MLKISHYGSLVSRKALAIGYCLTDKGDVMHVDDEQITEERLRAHREHSSVSATLAKMEQQRMDDQR